ncbi:carbohydrate ABC transporter permease [Halorarius halobius]|uniref:carbohydrate ABC transporter permease n=1 Tax=Halorarius halobius TaxID=2962671 RepID=UPI0020CFDEFD|nr:sugar ABC transporter permease [Halorarius halobius]
MASENASDVTNTDILSRMSIRLENEGYYGVLSVLPVLLLYTLIFLMPVSFAIYASFHDIRLVNPNWTFVGIQNYFEVLGLEQFWQSLGRGVVYMVSSTLFQLAVGVWMALVLNQITVGQRLLTAVIFTAYLIPTIVVVLVGLLMFDPYVGVLHGFGAGFLNLWDSNLSAFSVEQWAMPVVVLIGSWKFSVFVTIFTLAQLRSIPPRFYEAAKVCGANKWQMFRDITFPRIRGVILVVVLLRSVFMFNKFDVIWMLTQGGPGYGTTTLPVLAYRVTFEDGAYGLGNTIAVVMFAFLAVGGLLYFRLFDPSDEVDT